VLVWNAKAMLPADKSDHPRTGVTLELWQEFGEVLGAVIWCDTNSLHQLYAGEVSRALRKARQLSEHRGFRGCYEISGTDAGIVIRATDRVLREIDDQLGALQSRVGASTLHNGNLITLAAMPTARAQLIRLRNLRDSLLKNRAAIA
jgi:hypothetical protein